LLISGSYVALLIAMVLIQPDFGSAIVLLSIWFGMVVISGIKIRHLGILFLIMVLLLVGSWFLILKDYQKQRVLLFKSTRRSLWWGISY